MRKTKAKVLEDVREENRKLKKALQGCIAAIGRINLGLLRPEVSSDCYAAQLKAEEVLGETK